MRRVKCRNRITNAQPCRVHMCYLRDLLVFDIDSLHMMRMRMNSVMNAIKGYTLRFIIR